MIYVVNKKRRIIIYLLNAIGLVFYPFYKLAKGSFFSKKSKILAGLKNGTIKSIAINCIDRLGDTLFLLPSVKALKKAHPAVHLIIITNHIGKEIFKNNPWVDEIIIADNPWIGQSLVNIFKLLKSFNSQYFENIKIIKKKKIDLLLDFKGDFRNLLFFDIWLSAKYIAGYALSGFGWLLDWEIGYKKGVHEIDAKLNLAKELGAEISDRELVYYLTEDEERFAEDFYKKNGVDEDRLRIVIHPGGTWEPRLWPVKNFLAISKKFINEKNAKLVIIGDQREKEKFEEIHSSLPEIILADNLNIGQVAAIIKQADLFIGNDSGPAHLARSVKTPLISIFGPEKINKVGPEDYGIALRHDFPCSPCGQVSCGLNPNCVQSITVEEVWSASMELLAKNEKNRQY